MEHGILKEWIFDFAFNEALVDATRRTAVAGNKELVRKTNAKAIVKTYVDNILAGN